MTYIETILDSDEKIIYKKMLDTFYILLMCDQAFIKEFDENEIEYTSATWLYSYKTFYEAIGYGRFAYPQGSISANRLFYKALKNYNTSAKNNSLTILIKTGLGNFLKLRRDDSSSTLPSYMYGSTYEIIEEKGLGSMGKRRIISHKINFRHTANALSILLSDTNNISSDFLTSYKKMLINVEDLFSSDNEEKNLHITLASILNVLQDFVNKFKDPDLIIKSKDIQRRAEKLLLSKNSLVQGVNGYGWKLMSEYFRRYDYYLTFFTFEQYPYILKYKKAQKIIESIIENNTVEYKGLRAVPISPLNNLSIDSEIKPDFGITISLVFVLHFCVENNIGGATWIRYCKKYIRPYLKFCLVNFENQDVHQITMLESAAKSLLLPNIELSEERDEKNSKIINTIRQKIELSPKSLSTKLFDGNQDNKFIIEYIQRWNIESHKEKDSNNKRYYKLATILGGFSGSFTKEFLS